MKKIKLSERIIIKLLEKSETEIDFLLNLYKEVIQCEWKDVKSLNGFPMCNRKTVDMIFDLVRDKYDTWNLNLLWLNKGFSGGHDEYDDWTIVLPKDLITLNEPIDAL